MDKKEIQCKVCNLGCNLTINKDGEDYSVKGNKCNRGLEFGVKEAKEPSRVLTGRALLKNAAMGRIPVKTSDVIPSELVNQVMEIITNTEVNAPVNKGDIIIKDILQTGVDVIAQRKVSSNN